GILPRADGTEVELHQRLLLSCALLVACSAAGQERPGAPPAPVTRAATATLSMPRLERLAGQGARISAAVHDLEADRPLAALGATDRLTPASLTKIITAAAALQTWPPDHTFVTELRAARAPVNGVVEGDLVVRGGGDATLDETTLWALAAQIRSHGITRVSGRVLVERAPFGDLRCDTVDRCTGLRRSSRAYNAAPSAIGVNYGSWCVMVRAPAGATRAQVAGCASGPLPVPLSGSVQVRAGGPALSVERSTDDNGDRIAVGGSIAPGSERMVHRAMSDPPV